MAPSADIMNSIKSNYVQGHAPITLKSHGQRTAQTCASHILPHLRSLRSSAAPKILDIGCGPGSITIGLAEAIPNGTVIGLDYSQSALDTARELAKEKGVSNVEFKKGDAYHLYWPDETFDVVCCHQCLIHVDDPGRVLGEMRRVCKKGGIVAAREADLGTLAIYPPLPGMAEMWSLWSHSIRIGGGEPNAGRHLLSWAREAGFSRSQITLSSCVDTSSTKEERKVIGTTYPERVLTTDIGKRAVEEGWVTWEDLEQMKEAWHTWVEDDDGYFGLGQTEIVCRKSDA